MPAGVQTLVAFLPELLLLGAGGWAILRRAERGGWTAFLALSLALVALGASPLGGEPLGCARDELARLARGGVLLGTLGAMVLADYRERAPAPGSAGALLLGSAGLLVLASALRAPALLGGFGLALGGLFLRLRGTGAGGSLVLAGGGAGALLAVGLLVLQALAGGGRLDELALPATAAPAPGLVALSSTCLALGLGFWLTALPFLPWARRTLARAPLLAWFGAAGAAAVAGAGARIGVGFQGLAASLGGTPWLSVTAWLGVFTMALALLRARRADELAELVCCLLAAQGGFLLLALSGLEAQWSVAPGFTLAGGVALGLQATAGILGHLALVALLLVSENELRDTRVAALRGLAWRNPWLAAAWALALAMSLGFPPTLGFLAKLAVFQRALGAGLGPAVALAVLSLGLLLGLSLTLLRLILFAAPAEPGPHEPLVASTGLSLATLGLIAAILFLGCWPDALLRLSAGVG